MVVIAALSIFVVTLIFTYLAVNGSKAGLFEDKNDNNIPDVVEEKVKKVKNEVVSRAKEVSKEVSDVKNAVKEVGKQISHVPGAVAGKKRAGRK